MTTKRRWMYAPPKPAKPKVPEYLKPAVKAKADEFAESFLKPNFIKEPPKDYQWNYPVDIFTKWHASAVLFLLNMAFSRFKCDFRVFRIKVYKA